MLTFAGSVVWTPRAGRGVARGTGGSRLRGIAVARVAHVVGGAAESRGDWRESGVREARNARIRTIARPDCVREKTPITVTVL